MDLSFGTDGVRGRIGADLDAASVRGLGFAAAGHLGSDRVVVGHDPRESGPELVDALAEGFVAGGVDVVSLGMAPTPAVACVAALDSVAGAMVSASHNPWWDNGVKLFAAGGRKLGDETQAAIQEVWHRRPRLDPTGNYSRAEVADRRWADSVVGSVAPGALTGMRLVVDCANGATSLSAGGVLSRLGAQVTVIHDSPDGRNINERCGSTRPESLQDAVVSSGADAGLAFDGDGDRVVAVASDGSLLDGDHLLAICAVDRLGRGLLTGSTVVVTVMANLGLRRGLADHEILVHETDVGDRNVLEALDTGGWSLGGEQSGHIVFPEFASTGDGLLTGVQVLDAVVRAGRTIGDMAAELVSRTPQVLESIPVSGSGAAVVAGVADLVQEEAGRLGSDGRVLVRPSGTEPVVRVMVEAVDAGTAESVAERLCEAVRNADAGTGTGAAAGS
jgi:phosphoglucosamine mutase